MRKRQMQTLWVMGLLWLATAGAVRADEWGPPTLEHWSANRKFVLRVTGWGSPKEKATLTLKRVTGKKETPIWTVPTPLDGTFKIPHVAYVRDDGRSVVLRDQYHELGHGKVLVFLGEKGQELRAYQLGDLFSQGEILKLQHSISSIWWSGSGLFRFVPGRNQFGFITYWGAVGVFDLTNGKRLPLHGPDTDAFRREALKIARQDIKGSNMSRGVMLAGLLKDREAISLMKNLLTDTSHPMLVITNNRQDYRYELQLEAGRALVNLLGKDAVPLLEARLKDANPSMAIEWMDMIQRTGMAAQSQQIPKWASHADPDVRLYAVIAITENRGVDVVRRHPEWTRDSSENVRVHAVRCLAQYGDGRDIAVLRQALDDRDSSVSLWAMRGLIRLKPSDLETLLRRNLEPTTPRSMQTEARIALADLGDAEQLRWCVAQLEGFPDLQSKTAIGLFELPDAARVLVRHRPQGTEAALRKVSQLPDRMSLSHAQFEAIGLGGLAALGDKAALKRIRELAETGELFSAVEAIKWLGVAKDRDSIPLLRSLLEHREAMIRDEARKALTTLGAPEKEPPKTAGPSEKVTTAGPSAAASSFSPFWLLPLGALASVCVGYVALRGRRH